jgi:hypothetical protein
MISLPIQFHKNKGMIEDFTQTMKESCLLSYKMFGNLEA